MSKHLITDDDAIEVMDLLFKLSYNEDGDFDSNIAGRADYILEKICMLSGRDYKEYFDLLVKLKEKK